MAIEYQVRRSSRRCAATGRDLAPGEAFIAALVDDGREVVRRDYAYDAWNGPNDDTVAWWRSQTPRAGGSQPAPREVLLGLLDEWADQPQEAAARYLLALLLVRRRVLRIDGAGFLEGLQGADPNNQRTNATLKLVCRERNEPIEVAVAPPSPAESVAIQARLADLLGAA